MATKTYTGTLYVADCPVCFVPHGIPRGMKREMEDEGGVAYCPNGHSWGFVDESRATQLDRARASEVALRDQLHASERSVAAHKGHATRIKNRVKAGVCPFCHRSFGNVRAHMDTKHSDE